MTDLMKAAIKGAIAGLTISVLAVSFIAGPESIWDWPAASRGIAATFSVLFCIFTAIGAVALEVVSHD